MQALNLYEQLKNNEYPGRGIVIGLHQDGDKAVIAYFIMGRSVNSRNRIFKSVEDGIITKAYDESKMTDPHLIIYAPVRYMADGVTVVTNGDQTDTIKDFILDGKTFEEALRTRTFEDDAPNFTPRISGILQVKDGKAAYKLSILKSDDGNEASVQRFFYEYGQPVAGIGHFIHTYKCNGNPIPSFEGEPERVVINGSFDEFTANVWESLNEDNKVSLYTAFIDLKTGEMQTKITNKFDA